MAAAVGHAANVPFVVSPSVDQIADVEFEIDSEQPGMESVAGDFASVLADEEPEDVLDDAAVPVD